MIQQNKNVSPTSPTSPKQGQLPFGDNDLPCAANGGMDCPRSSGKEEPTTERGHSPRPSSPPGPPCPAASSSAAAPLPTHGGPTPTPIPIRRASTSLDDRFARWIGHYPDVLDLFVQFARELIRSGRSRYSAKAIVERIRWHYATSAHGSDEEFALNNSYTSRLVRLAIVAAPDIASLFQFRSLSRRQPAPVSAAEESYGLTHRGSSLQTVSKGR